MQINLKYILFFKVRIKTCSYIYNNNKVNRQFVYSDVIRDVTHYLRKSLSLERGICVPRQILRYAEFPRTNTPTMGKDRKKIRIG